MTYSPPLEIRKPPCRRCSGMGIVPCRCAGTICLCDRAGWQQCPSCGIPEHGELSTPNDESPHHNQQRTRTLPMSNHPPEIQFAYFDRLPSLVRAALNNSALKFCSVGVAHKMAAESLSSSQIIRAIEMATVRELGVAYTPQRKIGRRRAKR